MNVLVVGATGGIGMALVRQLRIDGHDIVTVSEKNPSADMRCDITDSTAVTAAFEEIIASKFLPDCVIVASGVFEDDLIPEYNRRLLDRNFAVNFFGVLNLIDAALPHFIAEHKGHIIVLSSLAALRPNKRAIGYPASKAALSLAVRGFDLAFRPKGLVFSNVYVGPTRTSMWEGGHSFLTASPEKIARDIAALVKSRKATLYTPSTSTTLGRIALVIPDQFYMLLRKILLR
jgi:short-subunit dehydrogenase